jgi:hypothetical protein
LHLQSEELIAVNTHFKPGMKIAPRLGGDELDTQDTVVKAISHSFPNRVKKLNQEEHQ